MTDQSMSRFRCWSAESIASTVFSDIGALPGDADAIFLAAHTPMALDHVKGEQLADGIAGEQLVLEALLGSVGDQKRNTLVAVTGGSGIGKSHVVRWVHAHLPDDDPRYRVMYVPRAVQTLRDLLRRIIDALPGEGGSELMSRIDEAIANVKPGELQDRLVNEMKLALDWTLEDRARLDGESDQEAFAREERNSLLGEIDEQSGGRVDGLADLLDLPQVKEALMRSEGRLNALVTSYFNQASRRDDNDIFTPDDLPLNQPGIRRALAGQPGLAELWNIISQQPEMALELLEEALRVALPKVVGLHNTSGETLDSLFLASRRALREEGQELVLVFEDLAQFGLVDADLYNQFVTPPGEDLAPLRVIFAVTDGAYARMERTVRTRVTHEFHVGGSALAEASQFVGRYLNLIRVGGEEAERLRPRGTGAPGESHWMKNACDTREAGLPCRVRDECFSAFDSVTIDGLGDVGLYPYNNEALNRALRNLGDEPTPREVLDECVSTNLKEADVNIGNGTYPHERTREQFQFQTRMGKDALLAQFPSSDPDRTYRALVIWGNEAVLPAGVLTAFDLSLEEGSPTLVTPLHPGPIVVQSPPQDSPLLPLFQWQNEEHLPEADVTTLRETLRRLTVDRLQLEDSLIHVHSGHGKQLLDGLFNVTSFAVEGASGRHAGGDAVRFDITREPEDVRILVAARWLRDHGHFNPEIAKWPWPDGYEPAQLMVELEARLDLWASCVRERFLEATGGSRLAQFAVGLAALCLSARGEKLEAGGDLTVVLQQRTGDRLIPSESWQQVDEVAARILSSLSALDYVADFAAVRQGKTGEANLVDPSDLNRAFSSFLTAPEASLERVTKESVDPVLESGASDLLHALVAAAPEASQEAEFDFALCAKALEGHNPGDVGRQAEEVGRLANEAGVFRPSDKYVNFITAVEVLDAASSERSQLPGTGADVLIREQAAIRAIHRQAEALGLIQHVMEETKQECEHTDKMTGSVASLKKVVKDHAEESRRLVRELTGGDSRDLN